MVESKLYRLPRNGKPEPVYLFQISVELGLSKNPKVHDMFTDAQAKKEMNTFFQTHRIRINCKYEKGGKVNRIELRGSPEGLATFHETCLTEDNSAVVYNLEYR